MDFQIKHLYREWQKQPIDSLSYDYISIGKAISYFISDGLFPLIHTNGYTISKNKKDFEDILASMMFTYSRNKTKIYRVCETNLGDEMHVHYDYYCNTITYETWNHFWKTWDNEFINLFNYYENDLCAQIQCIVWECIDLKNSSTYYKYLEETCESDDETIVKSSKQEDSYILDNMNRYENQ
jgi:hypothetical protein